MSNQTKPVGVVVRGCKCHHSTNIRKNRRELKGGTATNIESSIEVGIGCC